MTCIQVKLSDIFIYCCTKIKLFNIFKFIFTEICHNFIRYINLFVRKLNIAYLFMNIRNLWQFGTSVFFIPSRRKRNLKPWIIRLVWSSCCPFNSPLILGGTYEHSWPKCQKLSVVGVQLRSNLHAWNWNRDRPLIYERRVLSWPLFRATNSASGFRDLRTRVLSWPREIFFENTLFFLRSYLLLPRLCLA